MKLARDAAGGCGRESGGSSLSQTASPAVTKARAVTVNARDPGAPQEPEGKLVSAPHENLSRYAAARV